MNYTPRAREGTPRGLQAAKPVRGSCRKWSPASLGTYFGTIGWVFGRLVRDIATWCTILPLLFCFVIFWFLLNFVILKSLVFIRKIAT